MVPEREHGTPQVLAMTAYTVLTEPTASVRNAFPGTASRHLPIRLSRSGYADFGNHDIPLATNIRRHSRTVSAFRYNASATYDVDLPS